MTASHVTDDGGFQTASSSSAPGGIGRCGDEPTFSRREVLGLLGIASAAVVGGCSGPWAVPEGLVKKALRGPGLVSEVETVCGLCPGACGLTVRLVDGLPVGLKGNPNHPLNRGGLCPVGMAGLEVLYAPNRLRHPLRKGPGGGFRRVDWDQALEEIARRLKESAAKSDQVGSVAAICGPSSLLFQDLVEHLAGRMGRFQCLFTDQENALPYALTQGLDGLPALDWSGSDLVLSFGFDLFEDGPAPIHA
ncbi:MAG TPA: molybdopterin-dependent oxidoreductase, partial [Acidobacteriota bacterium]|nr:molybdopterin-dependent oxidoreductase [Acidobacteriota bacterium]